MDSAGMGKGTAFLPPMIAHLSGEHERCDDKSREELRDGQGRKKSDGHRKLHRHFSFDDVLPGFIEYRESADKRGRNTDYADTR